MKTKRYTLTAGRCINIDGEPTATLHGVGNYVPAALDDLAREIVHCLNWMEGFDEEPREMSPEAKAAFRAIVKKGDGQ